MLNKRGPNIETCGTPDSIFSVPKNCKMSPLLFFFFCLSSSLVVFSNKLNQDHTHGI